MRRLLVALLGLGLLGLGAFLLLAALVFLPFDAVHSAEDVLTRQLATGAAGVAAGLAGATLLWRMWRSGSG